MKPGSESYSRALGSYSAAPWDLVTETIATGTDWLRMFTNRTNSSAPHTNMLQSIKLKFLYLWMMCISVHGVYLS